MAAMPGWMRWVTAAMAAVIAGLAVSLALVLSGSGDAPAPTSGPDTTAPPITAPPTSAAATTTTTAAVAAPDWEVVGVSLLGRDLRAATFGDGPVRVYVLAGIHGDERAATESGPLLVGRWSAGGLPGGVTVRFLEEANPDGVVAATRANAAGVDLNRNFPTADFEPSADHGPAPLSEPESAALEADLEAFGPDLIVALHCEWEGPFVNYDGPAGSLALAFATAAARVDPAWEVRPALPYPTPGSLGTHYGLEGGLPVVTVEMSRYATAAEQAAAVLAGMDALLAAAAAG